jgi:hypothetical protein
LFLPQDEKRWISPFRRGRTAILAFFESDFQSLRADGRELTGFGTIETPTRKEVAISNCASFILWLVLEKPYKQRLNEKGYF